jgi:hypothetical protein
MTPVAVQFFYGILAVLAIGAVVIIWGVRGAALVSAGARARADLLADTLAPGAILLASAVAVLATAGSLYFLAALRRDGSIVPYGWAVASIGAAISAYHVALEWVPALDTGVCDATVPCTVVWFRALGIFSLPTLALVAFALILTLLSVAAMRRAPDGSPS